ncbi:hypothetical protein G9A89_001863 [Geosiphon pyriformis]|nr:hypothetical protein G9A89_001863 [Geosiphon pyriformis]
MFQRQQQIINDSSRPSQYGVSLTPNSQKTHRTFTAPRQAPIPMCGVLNCPEYCVVAPNGARQHFCRSHLGGNFTMISHHVNINQPLKKQHQQRNSLDVRFPYSVSQQTSPNRHGFDSVNNPSYTSRPRQPSPNRHGFDSVNNPSYTSRPRQPSPNRHSFDSVNNPSYTSRPRQPSPNRHSFDSVNNPSYTSRPRQPSPNGHNELMERNATNSDSPHHPNLPSKPARQDSDEIPLGISLLAKHHSERQNKSSKECSQAGCQNKRYIDMKGNEYLLCAGVVCSTALQKGNFSRYSSPHQPPKCLEEKPDKTIQKKPSKVTEELTNEIASNETMRKYQQKTPLKVIQNQKSHVNDLEDKSSTPTPTLEKYIQPIPNQTFTTQFIKQEDKANLDDMILLANAAPIINPLKPKCGNSVCINPCSSEPNGNLSQFCAGSKCSSEQSNRNYFDLTRRIPSILQPQSTKNTLMVPASAILGVIDSGRECANSSCHKPVYVDPKEPTKFHAFCNNRCYWIEVAQLNKTKVAVVDKNDVEYARILRPLLNGLPPNSIKAILRIQMSKNIAYQHLELRKAMGVDANIDPTYLTHRLYHGTNVACGTLGIIHGGTVCSNSQCGMCGILKEGNKSIKSKHQGSMFFTNHPQKAFQAGGNGKTKAIFIVDVLAPKYESELVINNDAASLPRYLILCE